MSGIDAVCFDLDSTLCMSNQPDSMIHREVFERAEIDPLFTPADIRAVDTADVKTAENDAEFYTNLYRATLTNRSADIDLDSSLLVELGEITTEVVDESDVSFRPGAEEALEYTSEHYEVGLITNGGERTQKAKLKTLGISNVFDVTMFCDPSQGISPKPALDPFRRALSGLSASAEMTIYVGDSHTSDVVGADKAGFQSVWVPPNRQHETHPSDPDPAPTHRIESLTELPEIL